MSPVELALFVLAGVGVTLVIGELPWFRRSPLAGRLRPYAPPTTAGSVGAAPNRAAWRSVLQPVAEQFGERLGRIFGLNSDLALRLSRAGLPTDTGAFRLRQLVHGLIGLGVGTIVVLLVSPGPIPGLFAVVGAPLLWVLLDEQRVTSRAAERTRRLSLELPVVSEQLGILLSGGWSLPAAINRIGARGRGVAAADLRRIALRIRHGLSETDALKEWADESDHDGVRRLVAVLSLHREASDLGSLISAESRSIRAEGHRQLVETLERRSQLVWVPVTVATLVPGLLFLAVPFLAAMTKVSGGG